MSRRFGQYELTRKLGAGGMGEVWGAVKLGTVGGVKMPCAIKLMRPEFAQTDDERERFLNEARIAAQLDHGRIVKVNDVGEVGGTLYLVMDRVDGVDLRTFLQKFQDAGGERLPQHITVFIVAEMLSALAYAHNRTIGGRSAAVIHHDITPGNILVSSSGELKLTDFGISRFGATAGLVSRPIGTLRYMAPEMFLGDYGKPASDVYQLGVILHELLAGRRYLAGVDGETFRRLVMSGPPAALEGVTIPHWLEQLRSGMLATDSGQRPSARAALSLVLRNSSAHAGAGEELRQLYEQVVGDSRSGFTEFMQVVRDQPTMVPGAGPTSSAIAALAAESTRPEESGPDWWGSESPSTPAPVDAPIERTQMLAPAFDPPVAGTRPTSPTASSTLTATPPRAASSPPASPASAAPAAAAAPPASAAPASDATSSQPHVIVSTPSASASPMPWGVLTGLGVTILGLIGVLAWLLVAQREGDPAPPPDDPPPALVVSDAKPDSSESDSTTSDSTTSDSTTSDSTTSDSTTSDSTTSDSTTSDSGDIEKPKPKPVVKKMAVSFTIDKIREGEIKIGGKVHPYKNYLSTTVSVGKHTISWRASGQKDFTRAGTLSVDDIGSDLYQVTLRAGSLERKKLSRPK
jgi:serine/threonine protein kinase